jgi:hypothetical protein
LTGTAKTRLGQFIIGLRGQVPGVARAIERMLLAGGRSRKVSVIDASINRGVEDSASMDHVRICQQVVAGTLRHQRRLDIGVQAAKVLVP